MSRYATAQILLAAGAVQWFGGSLFAFQNEAEFDAATLKVVLKRTLDASAGPVQAPFRGWNYTPGRVSCVLPLRSLVREAYDLKDWQISGPAFLDGDFYALEATMPEGTKKSEARLMLRALLKERLQLRFHLEQRVIASYALTADKGGFKMKPDGERPKRYGFGLETGRLFGNGVPFGTLADALRSVTGRPVMDETGIQGYYSFDWVWTPDPEDSKVGAKTLDPGFVAVLRDKAGLRLEPRKIPQEVMVIDHLDKTPAEN